MCLRYTLETIHTKMGGGLLFRMCHGLYCKKNYFFLKEPVFYIVLILWGYVIFSFFLFGHDLSVQFLLCSSHSPGEWSSAHELNDGKQCDERYFIGV